MKFFFAFILVVASASARGSGPYLPSGWRPKGPAFLLPSEIIKQQFSSAAEQVQEPQFPETEASGSDALREYGPPKLEEVTLSVNQALPELVTEQAYFIAKNKAVVGLVGDAETNIVKVNEEQVAVIAEDVSNATESQETESIQTREELTTEISNVKPSIEVQPLAEVKQEEEIECEDITDHVNIVASTTEGANAVTLTVAVERQSSDLLQNVNEIAEEINTEKNEAAAITVENIVVPTDGIAVQELTNSEQLQLVSEVTQSDKVQELTTQEYQKETIVNAISNIEKIMTPTITINTQDLADRHGYSVNVTNFRFQTKFPVDFETD